MPQSLRKNSQKSSSKISKTVKKTVSNKKPVKEKKEKKLKLSEEKIEILGSSPEVNSLPLDDVLKTPKVVKKPTIPPPSTSKKWVCVELTSIGEKEKRLNLLTRSIYQILKINSLDVFIPAITQKVRDESSVLSYMEGYIFIEYRENVNYMRLHETNYFKIVLMRPSYEGRRKKMVYSLLVDDNLSSLRKGVDNLNNGDFKSGDMAKVIKGNFKGLPAEVIDVIDGNIQVYVNYLKSKKLILEFPPTYLVKL
jgi:hypothetical protein